MEEYKSAEKKRTARQVFMGALFLLVVVAGWRYPLLGYFIPMCMLLGIGIGVFKGRKWCDWLCPRGGFFDAWLKPLSPKKEIPKFLKGLPLRLGIIIFLFLVMAIQIIVRWPNPYKIGMFFVVMLTVTTLLGIILGLFFHQRSWCCFCPIGTIANLVGGNRHPLKIDSQSCTECKLCQGVCPIQIAPYRFKKTGVQIVKDGDCLKCKLCVLACPKGALNFSDKQPFL